MYLLSTDFDAYKHGVNTEYYRNALRHTDKQIGRVLADMERAGLLDKIYIAFCTDHSMMAVEHHFRMTEYLAGTVGLKVARDHWWETDPYEKRVKDYEKYSTVVYGGGDRYWAICLRKPIRHNGHVNGFEPWSVRPSCEGLP